MNKYTRNDWLIFFLLPGMERAFATCERINNCISLVERKCTGLSVIMPHVDEKGFFLVRFWGPWEDGLCLAPYYWSSHSSVLQPCGISGIVSCTFHSGWVILRYLLYNRPFIAKTGAVLFFSKSPSNSQQ